ncbi:MAG: Unknown protein [uncultured Sulfurovum sp.]|uniref:NERD domain-containing protein n=1 Tax=uncultured Sulfurovum sp. TaxID=269237 RepID=A0A6S6RTU2_9BACT|nr:MAG: Unknown protein [uncultured Sulfurovum sp.]
MIFKQIDSKDTEINTLKNLMTQSNSTAQKKMISQTLKALENGYKAEKENAYYLNFMLEERKRSLLLHDIRLEHNGKTAQFDHIFINGLGIIILESKSFIGSLTIDEDNSMSVKYKGGVKTFPSPVEQNNRHKIVLDVFLKEHLDLSARFKLMGGVRTEGVVLIHPNTTVTNKKLPKGFERSDSFITKRDEAIEKMGFGKVMIGAVTLLTIENMKEIARLLVAHHKPITFDYSKKFRIAKPTDEEILQKNKERWGKPTEKKEIIEDSPVSSDSIECPRCKSGTLVKRKRKSKKNKDKYHSNEFMGCSRFPKCRYVQEI